MHYIRATLKEIEVITLLLVDAEAPLDSNNMMISLLWATVA